MESQVKHIIFGAQILVGLLAIANYLASGSDDTFHLVFGVVMGCLGAIQLVLYRRSDRSEDSAVTGAYVRPHRKATPEERRRIETQQQHPSEPATGGPTAPSSDRDVTPTHEGHNHA